MQLPLKMQDVKRYVGKFMGLISFDHPFCYLRNERSGEDWCLESWRWSEQR